MLGITFMKAEPHVFVLHYQNGKIRHRGRGLSFYYYAPISSIVAVPVNTVDIPFAFTLVTKDFQTITLQGQLSYRVTDPERLAGLLNFTLKHGGGYMSDDPAKMADRLLHLTQTTAQSLMLPMALYQALVSADALAASMLNQIRASEVLAMHGVEVLTFSILNLRPTPDMAKALEAETREELQQKSDQATYTRRNAAIEQERTIKENELNTELLVEAKRREIRESQMAGEIAIEEQRAHLLEQKIVNEQKEADSRAYTLATTLAPLKEMDWRTLMALNSKGNDAKLNIALAFRELAEKAQKIGTLNITPDLLERLTQSDD
jgi:regulator of protease activity HflC (stomatin/prohibitin superfamily)